MLIAKSSFSYKETKQKTINAVLETFNLTMDEVKIEDFVGVITIIKNGESIAKIDIREEKLKELGEE